MFHGSMVALVTPMFEDGSLDFESLDKLIEYHIENKTDAIIAVGTTGESATLDEEEHCATIKRAVQTSAGRIPIIAGTGSNSTREAIQLTQCAMEAGADACLLVTPYYNKPTQEGLYLHYREIAKAVAIPQILYNVPGRTACDMLPETIARLAEIPNIIGVKEATGDLGRAELIIELCGDKLDVYSGDDATAMDLILMGGKGDISVTANVAPLAMHNMCKAALEGDLETAAAINEPLLALHENLFLEANPIPVKWALYEMGLIKAGIRLPMTLFSETHHEALRQALKQANLL